MSEKKDVGSNQQLHRLVYISKAVRLMHEEDHLGILNPAREYNQAHGITGMLLYKDMSYLQLLEGPKQVLEDLYVRICEDERHIRVQKLLDEQAERRYFDSWSMGFHSLDSEPAADLPAYSEFMNADYDVSAIVSSPDLAMRMLLHFRAYS